MPRFYLNRFARGNPHSNIFVQCAIIDSLASLQRLRETLNDVEALTLKKGTFKLKLSVEMVFDDMLVASGDKDEVLDAGLTGLIHDVLNERAIHYRKHLFGHCFGGREKSCAKSSDWEYGLTDTHLTPNIVAQYGCRVSEFASRS